MRKIGKGSLIYCPNDHYIGRLVKNIYVGDPFKTSQFDFEDGQEKATGERTLCNVCGEDYMPDIMLHCIRGRN